MRHDGTVLKQRSLYVSGGIFGLAACVSLALPGSFIIEQAGPALDVTGEVDGVQLLDISGTQTYPSDTQLFMTTVSAFGNADYGVSGVQAVAALASPEQELIPVRALYSAEESASDVDKQNTAMMTSSQDSGTVAGLEAAGMEVPMTLTVAGTDESAASNGKLKEGDVLTSITVAGTKTQITTFSDLSGVLAKTPAGTQVTIGFTRDKKEQEVAFATQAFETDNTGWDQPGSRLGVYLTPSDLDFPINVTYGVENIGGPSAGTMFALGIYDELTKGSLGGDTKIAGTGTMSFSGEVGAIGGIRHKMVGAASEGAEYFLAPATNCAETVGFEPEGMQVFSIRTLQDAIEATEAIGSGDTSSLTTCAAVAADSPESDS